MKKAIAAALALTMFCAGADIYGTVVPNTIRRSGVRQLQKPHFCEAAGHSEKYRHVLVLELHVTEKHNYPRRRDKYRLERVCRLQEPRRYRDTALCDLYR